MTREERLDWLCRLRGKLIYFDMPDHWRKNFTHALSDEIQALEQEPCEDAISRQAVEDAIAEMTVNGESLGYAVAYDILSDLPPVTLEPCEDCISRKAVSDTIYIECSGENLDIDFAKVLLLQRAIKTLPSVTPKAEQEPILDKIRAEIEFEVDHRTYMLCAEDVFDIIDKYKAESEDKK